MIKNLFGRWARARFALPVMLVLGGLVIAVNESTYLRTTATLKSGIELTDARIAVAQIMQLLTDAETAQRGFVLSGEAEMLVPYRQSIERLPALRARLAELLATATQRPAATAQDINIAIDAKLYQLASVVRLVDTGQRDAAVRLAVSGESQLPMRRLREMFADALKDAAGAQGRARVSIYDALLFNRVAIGTLTLIGMVGLYFFLRQIRARDAERSKAQEQLEEKVQSRTRELRHLARHLQNVEEDLREHLARELHDELGGVLTAAKLDLARIGMRVKDDPVLLERLAHASVLINQGIALKRRIIEDLRPTALTMMGVKRAIQLLSDDMQTRLDIPFIVEVDDLDLNEFESLVVYRFVQEALTNIAKYAAASHVWIGAHERAGRVEIMVRDDGVGFDPAASTLGRHGLTGMRFRIESVGGTMAIDAEPNKGARLVAQFQKGASTAEATAARTGFGPLGRLDAPAG